MASSRKRKRTASVGDAAIGGLVTKRPQVNPSNGNGGATTPKALKHALLSQYYPEILTLRHYLLLKLPSSSKIRRKKIAAVGLISSSTDNAISDVELAVATLLDTTLVGQTQKTKDVGNERWAQWTNFSQRGDDSYVTLSDGVAGAVFSQSEIVDFVMWTLFSKSRTAGSWPKHLLCDGFRRNPASRAGASSAQGTNIPGIYSAHPNHRVRTLKQDPWPKLLKLLGGCGDRIMIDLLLDCAVFVGIEAGQGNYQQISGEPLYEGEPLQHLGSHTPPREDQERPPSDISFVRNRMLYARAALSARGLVHFGLRHIHVLNRAPYRHTNDQQSGDNNGRTAKQNCSNTLRVMMYMFPRQFGLHNVFTSRVNFTETAQRLKDYTLREEEISAKYGKSGQAPDFDKVSKPRRLRGRAAELVQKLQTLHARCSYSKLIEHYCPVVTTAAAKQPQHRGRDHSHRTSLTFDTKRSNIPSQLRSNPAPEEGSRGTSLIALATSTTRVSAFCQAVVSKVIPNQFWGDGCVQAHNKALALRKVDQFIRLRRFESMSLHEVMQGMKVTEIEWLAPPKLLAQQTSQTDIRKRTELFYEFLYYVFDSILIPLLRSNFYITESNAHKYRLFFFRHDVWRYVAEPAMASLKVQMFEEVNLEDACRLLDTRRLGYSQIRLLPKEIGIRPIMNLRRRAVMRGNKKILGPSINTILGPVHTVLQLEKSLKPENLGSALFSVGDIYRRLKEFKTLLGGSLKPLYFAKLDVRSAFDTIPQSAIVGLLDSIPQQPQYTISKHVEIASNRLEQGSNQGRSAKSKPLRKWHSTALENPDSDRFLESLGNKRAANKRDTVFIDSVVKKKYETSDLLNLVASHIQQNLVKIGKKYYRQKRGIPQGSVLSSTLCNYFYADLERHVLNFLDSNDCLLLRLIDDFLLITTDKEKAVAFVRTMQKGVPEYGVKVNPSKTLVNFDLSVDDKPVPKLPVSQGFPYCGISIDCKTLDITRGGGEKNQEKAIYNSLTVELTRSPGLTFQRKVMNAFKIQSHLMFFDTSLNSAKTMLSNIFRAFSETATKMWAYARCLPQQKQPAPELIVKTISGLVDMAFLLLISKRRKLKYPGYECDVKKAEVAWLAYTAFQNVLDRKQSRYGTVLAWLLSEIRKLSTTKDICRGRVTGLAL